MLWAESYRRTGQNLQWQFDPGESFGRKTYAEIF
jgi:hypothetical protein